MSYTFPDVFVSVDIPEPTPVVESPGLPTCLVGEHYFVQKDAFVANVTTSSSGPWDYPNLPTSANDTSSKLGVDASGDFAPTFSLVTNDGTELDVTDEINATASDFSVSGTLPKDGALFVSYRARDDRYAGTELELLSVKTFDDLTTLFGADGIGPANPLGYAMYQAWTHAGVEVNGVAVTNPTSNGTGSYTATISDETAAYQEAFDFLKVQDVYMVVPLTFNEFVHSATEAHVDHMSSASGGNQERRTILAPKMEGSVVVRRGDGFTPWYPITDDTATDLADTFSSENAGAEITRGGYRIVKAAASTYYIRDYIPSSNGSNETVTLDGTDYIVNFTGLMLAELDDSAVMPPSRRIQSSDTFGWTADDGSSVSASIQTIPLDQHESVIEVDAGNADPVDTTAWQVTRTVDINTDRDALIRAYQSKSRGVDNERVTNIMPHWVGDTQTGQDVPAYFAAAQLAAEASRTSEEPAGAALGVGRFTGLRDSTEHLFRSVRYFTSQELEDIAGAGWTILANERMGQTLNTLHTLTTDASSIERMELTLGVERDYLAWFFRQEMKEDLRQFRINERTINAVQLRAAEVATVLSDPQSTHYRYQDVTIKSVEQDENTPDRIVYKVEGRHLYPYNDGKVEATIIT